MKALTIWQPWASLIMAGAKPYEFRRWRAPKSIIGQRIVIHAGARKCPRHEYRALFENVRREELYGQGDYPTCIKPEIGGHLMRVMWTGEVPMPYGAGIGTAILGEPISGDDVAAQFSAKFVNDSERNGEANWGWPLTDIEVWDEPIPMSGKQGFWNWPDPQDLGL